MVEDFDRKTYRAVYTVRFTGVVYVLHAFQKKSTKATATPLPHVKLVRARLKAAQAHYRTWTERL